MFTKEEVEKIQELARIARQYKRGVTQLNTLSRFARNSGLHELLLEIKVRAKDRKLARGLPEPLKEALENLSSEGDETKDRVKRAKFIDYIAKLAK
jgi:hypothetical protein